MPYYKDTAIRVNQDIKGRAIIEKVPCKYYYEEGVEVNMQNEFLNLMDSPLLKTDNVNRYSGIFQTDPERLSVHIVDVQMFSLMIARKLMSYGENIDIGKLLEKGLIHDVDETLTGDFTRLVKYSSKTCHDALEAVAESVVNEMSQDMDGTTYLADVWSNAKDATPEGYIIKLSDMLSVIKKISKEVDMLGNNHFLKVALEVSSYISDLYNSIPVDLFYEPMSIRYIKDLLRGVSEYLNSITLHNKEIIDIMKIDNSTVRYIVNNRFNKVETENAE